MTLIVIGSIALDARAAEPAPNIETELAHKMEQMNSALRKLRRQVADPARTADSLDQLAMLRSGAEAAVELTPLKATEAPAAKRAAMIEGYRVKMREMLALLDKLETALRAARNEEAAGILQEIVALQKTAHKEYKSESFD